MRRGTFWTWPRVDQYSQLVKTLLSLFSFPSAFSSPMRANADCTTALRMLHAVIPPTLPVFPHISHYLLARVGSSRTGFHGGKKCVFIRRRTLRTCPRGDQYSDLISAHLRAVEVRSPICFPFLLLLPRRCGRMQGARPGGGDGGWRWLAVLPPAGQLSHPPRCSCASHSWSTCLSVKVARPPSFHPR